MLGNIPSGTYDSSRLANLSTGYVAVNSGFGYTYLAVRARTPDHATRAQAPEIVST